MKKDNRGVSLSEVMIVVAIISIIGAVGITSLNLLTGRPAQQCSQQLLYSLERHRTSAFGKVQSQYVLRVDDSTGAIVADEYLGNGDSMPTNPTQTIEIGSSRVTVTYTDNRGNTKNLAGNPLTLQFNRSTGAFNPTLPGNACCTDITLKSGGRVYKVTMVPLTGKIYID